MEFIRRLVVGNGGTGADFLDLNFPSLFSAPSSSSGIGRHLCTMNTTDNVWLVSIVPDLAHFDFFNVQDVYDMLFHRALWSHGIRCPTDALHCEAKSRR